MHSIDIGDIYIRCAIYESGFDLLGETIAEVVEAQGVYSMPEWQTFEFADPLPELIADEYYVLVVSAVNSPYPIYVAYDEAEEEHGVEMEYEFNYWFDDFVLFGFNYPQQLDDPIATYEQYSIYCTIMPYPET